MATKSQNKPINSAIKVLSEAHNKAIQEAKSPSTTILDVVGMDLSELIGHYRYVIEQNKDMANKLKAMQPLLALHGIKWNEEQTKVNVPILNVTMEQPKDSATSSMQSPELIVDTENVEDVVK